jgi:hypothetical protein
MTAAMRAAAAPTGERVLRVAIVHAGRILEERVFRHPKSGFVDDDRWFEHRNGRYTLVIPSGAIGRVIGREGRVEVGPLAMRIPLDEASRGRVAFGTTTILFQFVVPPPQASRPALPLATRAAVIDWPLTIIVAFSFLVHFGVIGSMFSDWLDPVVESDQAVIGLIDMTHAPAPTVVEDQAPSGQATPGTTASHEPASAEHMHAPPSAAARAASLAREASAMQLNLLTALQAGPSVERALERSEIPVGDLDKVARDARGAEHAGGELKLTESTGVIPGGTDLRGLGVMGGGTLRTGVAREPDGPKVDVTTVHEPVPGEPPNVEGPIARLRPAFRACYTRKGLSVDPSMDGKLTIEFRIAPNGEVTDVVPIAHVGLSLAVEQCIIERAKNAAFDPPHGTGAHVRVPIIFRHQT